ncbi:MAG: DUF433 domain-containing protein [Bryobacteraceae bacterium]
MESIPGKRSGAWVFRDTRTPVSVVFDNLRAGATVGEVIGPGWTYLTGYTSMPYSSERDR